MFATKSTLVSSVAVELYFLAEARADDAFCYLVFIGLGREAVDCLRFAVDADKGV